uniref:sugar nucleotide-binding protein n=1 Tax=Klebsiella pneumoniae TaxID=573 RepID=UPI0022BA0DF3
YAPDLALALIQIIQSGNTDYGIYHFSNLGEATWFEFARKIFRRKNIEIDLQPVPTSAFPTAATRPAYSVMDKTKIM